MKTIILIRHGEAEYKSANGDFDRTLTNNGKKQIEKTSSFIKAKQIKPQIIISSPATRTEESIRIICEKLVINEREVNYNSDLYYKGMDEYIDQVISTNDDYNSLMIMGHNPAISQLANYFCSNNFGGLTTGAIVGFTFDVDQWEKLFSCDSSKITQIEF